jgi:predicted ATPase
MITLVEALNYRCLRYIRQPLDPFHVLVGPNASGKTTFLDVIAFLGRLVSDGLDVAIEERTPNFYDLLWRGKGTSFKVAVEAAIPPHVATLLKSDFQRIRYEIVVGIHSESKDLAVLAQEVSLRKSSFPEFLRPLPGLIHHTLLPEDPKEDPRVHVSTNTTPAGIEFNAEVPVANLRTWKSKSTKMLRHSVFRSLAVDDDLFPATSWLRDLLGAATQCFALEITVLRKPSPPGQGLDFRPDSSNLPWIVADLRQRSPERFRLWIAHLQTAFPDLEDIDTVERPEDRHRYLVLQYSGGFKVPSWMASDGTLRMLALTLPAYLDNFKGIYLIEEPENGVHPRAIETMMQSLSSVYTAQVLLATHSPIVLSTVEPEQVLCFSKNTEGATEIVRGSEHPALQQWKRETTLGTLFAAGVLG